MLNSFRRWGTAMLCIATCINGFAQGDTPAPEASTGPMSARDFFRNPTVRTPLVNGAGTFVAAIFDADNDETGAVFVNLKAKTFHRLTGSSYQRDVVSLNWMDDQRVLLYQIRRKTYADGLYVVNAGKISDNYPIVKDSPIFFISSPVADPTNPIVWIYRDAYNEGSDYGPVQLNGSISVDPDNAQMGPVAITSKESFVREHGTAATVMRSYPKYPHPQAVRFQADKNGELAFGVFSDKGADVLYVLQGKKWVRSPIDADDLDLIGAGDEPNEVIVLGPRQEGKPRALLRVDALTGQTKGVLHQDEAYDPKGAWLYRSPTTRNIVGVGMLRKAVENVWLDDAHKELGRELAKAFPGMATSVLGWDRSQNMIVVSVWSDQMPAAYFTYYRDKKDYDRFASSRPWVDYKLMRPTQALKYKTRDGFKVEGYLTLPEGASKQNPAPLVVLAHGGPWVRDSWGYDPEVQFLASRGYAVFQPNYRGSDGYGWTFPSDSAWEFRKMHEDVTDGTRKLIQSGLVDPKRIAIMGGSFGGYLAVCGAAWEPDLYRCAVTMAGVFDWSTLVAEDKTQRFDSIVYDVMVRGLGDPAANAEKYRALSPIHQVSAIRIPVLVAHGKDDPVVGLEQSKRLVRELSAHGVPHRTFFRGEEGHGMFKIDNRVALYTEIEKFLAENLK